MLKWIHSLLLHAFEIRSVEKKQNETAFLLKRCEDIFVLYAYWKFNAPSPV